MCADEGDDSKMMAVDATAHLKALVLVQGENLLPKALGISSPFLFLQEDPVHQLWPLQQPQQVVVSVLPLLW
jgi:hypothetical protein